MGTAGTYGAGEREKERDRQTERNRNRKSFRAGQSTRLECSKHPVWFIVLESEKKIQEAGTNQSFHLTSRVMPMCAKLTKFKGNSLKVMINTLREREG